MGLTTNGNRIANPILPNNSSVERSRDVPTSSLKTSKSLVSESAGGGESSQSGRGDYDRRRGAGAETVNSSYYDEIPTHETVHEALSDLRLQIGHLSKARKDMKEIIQKQEA